MKVTARDSAGTTLLRIDDTSARLVYSGQWSAVSNATSGSDRYEAPSVHTSGKPGSTIRFTFTGSFVAVYGVIDGKPVTASFTLDDSAPVTQSVAHPPSTPQYDWPFFSTEPLHAGEHHLVIQLQDGTFNLDYIDFTSTGELDDDGGDGSPVPAEPSSSSTSPPYLMASSSAFPSAFGGPRLSNGAIAGIASAGVVILVAIIAMLFCVFHRKARRVKHRRGCPEKPLDILPDDGPALPPPATRGPLRRWSRIYRPSPARSATTRSTNTSVTQSSAMFTSVIMLSPALSMVSEEPEMHHNV